MKKDTAVSTATLSARAKKQSEVDITKRVTHVDGYGRVSFNYPKHFTLQQRGITQRGGYGRIMSRIKVPRIASEQEKESARLHRIGDRKMPKALVSLYFN